MKNESGVTLIALVVTIIVMSIIGFVATSNSLELYKINKVETFAAKMQMIQERVNILREEYNMWEPPSESIIKTTANYYGGSKDDGGLDFSPASSSAYSTEFMQILSHLSSQANEKKIGSWQSGDENLANYYYFGPNDLENKLGVKNMNDMYVIVNFNTGNVVSREGVAHPNDETLIIYRQYDYLIGKQLTEENKDIGAIEAFASVEKNYGLSKSVKVTTISKKDGEIEKNPTLPDIYKVYYKLSDEEDWKDAANLKDYAVSGKTATFTIDVSGKYEFKVQDIDKNEYRMVTTNYLDITLCNPPNLIEGMTPIYWENGSLKETTDIYSAKWYDYSADSRKLANAKTPDGSMWVWIPRMCYTENISAGTIEYGYVSGISKTSINKEKTYKNVMPAFQDAQTGDEFTGFWVGKFGATIDATTGKTVMNCSSTQFSQVNASTAKVNCRNVDEKVKDDSHLMTGNERNAILYQIALVGLQQTDITSNNTSYPANTDYLTNKAQSSTKNEFGIYDLFPTSSEIIMGGSSSSTGRYRATLTPAAIVDIGDYVEYNIAYTDMYTGYEFTSTTGWRYIGEDSDGNKLLISTGVPFRLYYSSSGNAGRDNNGWWGTDEEVTEMFGTTYSASGYTGYPNRYAIVGLLKYFENIPYTKNTSDPTTLNAMTGNVTGNGAEGPLGVTLGTALRASDVSNKIVNIHNFKREELIAVLNADRCSESNDKLGIFYLRNLNNYGYSIDLTTRTAYWASNICYSSLDTEIDSKQQLWLENGDGTVGWGGGCLGVRPVITLDKSVRLLDPDRDGRFQIEFDE